MDFHDMAIRLYGENYNKDDLKIWRRKYLWFPADSECPAYYGSWLAKYVESWLNPLVVLFFGFFFGNGDMQYVAVFLAWFPLA